MSPFLFRRTKQRETVPASPQTPAELFERSGFEAFESGRTILDVPALVFVPEPEHNWPNFAIYDHRGVRLGLTRSERLKSRRRVKSLIEIEDSDQELRIRIAATGDLQGTLFEVSGAVEAEITSRSPSLDRLSFEANKEGYGLLVGPPTVGISAPEQTILDHRNQQVGLMRTLADPVRGKRPRSFAVSVKPGMVGPLRTLILTLPSVVTVLRVMQQTVIGDVAGRRWSM